MKFHKLTLALSLLCAPLVASQTTFGLRSAAANPAPAITAEPEKNGEKIDVDKLPKAVVIGVKKAPPGARITKAMTIVDDGKTLYYLDDVKVGRQGWDLTVAEDGKILKKEECHDEN